ncbi:lipopolysaccharide biosynthesis protein [Aeromonas caviae]|uniref:lipopolysaccharide biosynthesis protein n=1 Tax=Aeromonas caviae TaxID=648 RepID=UPI002B479EF1|nr:hypothetical protein [Aeromonas caviae]
MLRIIAKVLSGNILYFGSSWLMLAFTSKYYSIEAMGVMGLSISICAPLLILFGLSPRQLIVTGVVSDKKSYLGSRNVLLITCFVIIITTSYFLVDEQYYLIFSLFSFFKILESLYDFEYACFSKEKMFDRIIKIQKVRSFQLVIFIAASLWISDLNIALISIIFFNFIIIYKFKISFLISFNVRQLFSNIRLSGVISIATFVTLLYLNLPRYFLSANSLYIVGIFTGLVNIINVMRLIIESSTQSLLPFLTERFNTKEYIGFKKIIKKQVSSILLLTAIVLITYLLFGGVIFNVIYGNDFIVDNATVILAIIYGFCLCTAMVFNNAATAVKIFNRQLYISLTLCVFMLSIGGYLINLYSVSGAFISLIISSMAQSLLLAGLVSKRLTNK